MLTVQKTLLSSRPASIRTSTASTAAAGSRSAPGYRHYTGDRTHCNVAGLYSVPGYKLIEAAARRPVTGRDGSICAPIAGWRDATQVAYHGLGIDSPADAGTAFRMQQGYAGGDLTLRPAALAAGERRPWRTKTTR